MGKNDDSKNSKNPNLILLKSVLDKTKKEIELNDVEEDLKNKLITIENKLESIEKIVASISQNQHDTIFDSDAFSMLVGSIAISAAINAIAEYFEIDAHDIDNLLK